MANGGAGTAPTTHSSSSPTALVSDHPAALDYNYTIFGQLVVGPATLTDLTKVAVHEQLSYPGAPAASQPIKPVVINSVASPRIIPTAFC